MSSVDVVGGVLEFGDVERVEAGANGLGAFLLYSLPAVHQVRLHVRVCIQCMHTTSCHSTGNREPHRGCHLKPRTSTTYRIYPIITRWAGKCSPILRHSPADPGLNLLHASLGPPVAPEPYPKHNFDRFSHVGTAHGCVHQTDTRRHTDHATPVAIGRIYALCACYAA